MSLGGEMATVLNPFVDGGRPSSGLGVGAVRYGSRFRWRKVADWRDKEHELEHSSNLFAGFVLAHLKTVETDASPADR